MELWFRCWFPFSNFGGDFSGFFSSVHLPKWCIFLRYSSTSSTSIKEQVAEAQSQRPGSSPRGLGALVRQPAGLSGKKGKAKDGKKEFKPYHATSVPKAPC